MQLVVRRWRCVRSCTNAERSGNTCSDANNIGSHPSQTNTVAASSEAQDSVSMSKKDTLVVAPTPRRPSPLRRGPRPRLGPPQAPAYRCRALSTTPRRYRSPSDILRIRIRRHTLRAHLPETTYPHPAWFHSRPHEPRPLLATLAVPTRTHHVATGRHIKATHSVPRQRRADERAGC